MANESEFEALIDVIKSGSTFESLRAAEKLAKMSRRQRKSTDELIRDAVLSTADAYQNKGLNIDIDEIVREVQRKARIEHPELEEKMVTSD